MLGSVNDVTVAVTLIITALSRKRIIYFTIHTVSAHSRALTGAMAAIRLHILPKVETKCVYLKDVVQEHHHPAP